LSHRIELLLLEFIDVLGKDSLEVCNRRVLPQRSPGVCDFSRSYASSCCLFCWPGIPRTRRNALSRALENPPRGTMFLRSGPALGPGAPLFRLQFG